MKETLKTLKNNRAVKVVGGVALAATTFFGLKASVHDSSPTEPVNLSGDATNETTSTLSPGETSAVTGENGNTVEPSAQQIEIPAETGNTVEPNAQQIEIPAEPKPNGQG